MYIVYVCVCVCVCVCPAAHSSPFHGPAAHGSLWYCSIITIEGQSERDCLLELLFVSAVWLLECKHAGCEVFGQNCPPAFMATLSLIFEPPA